VLKYNPADGGAGCPVMPPVRTGMPFTRRESMMGCRISLKLARLDLLHHMRSSTTFRAYRSSRSLISACVDLGHDGSAGRSARGACSST